MISSSKISQITRFLSTGGLGVIAYYLILYILTDLIGMKYILSAIIASLVNFSLNFVLQKFWTFKSKGTKDIYRQLGKYAIMTTAFFIINLVLLYILVEYVHLWYLLAQFFITVLLTATSYLVSKLIFTDS